MMFKEFDDYIEIEVKGEVDILNSKAFKQDIFDKFEKYKKNIVLNCGTLEFLDSTGLGAFVAIHNLLKEYGKKLVLTKVNNRIVKLLTITGIDKVIEIS